MRATSGRGWVHCMHKAPRLITGAHQYAWRKASNIALSFVRSIVRFLHVRGLVPRRYRVLGCSRLAWYAVLLLSLQWLFLMSSSHEAYRVSCSCPSALDVWASYRRTSGKT